MGFFFTSWWIFCASKWGDHFLAITAKELMGSTEENMASSFMEYITYISNNTDNSWYNYNDM